MTKRVVIVVEGQTEEAFVNEVLQPHLGYDAVSLTPIVVHTSRSADGHAHRGGGSWQHYQNHLRRLLQQPHWDLVTTMIDFYGYPDDAPWCSCTSLHDQPTCAESRETGMRDAFAYNPRFLPFISLHEFETLIIAAGSQKSSILGDADAPAKFRHMLNSVEGNAEALNNGPLTAPSKRVLAALPDYRKVRDGVAVLEGDLGPALDHAPRFHDWVDLLAGAGA
ncbi:uncharacterized protein DUF4276 [Rathayibacter rathayi]|nr:uncharacterized protein DUF4276 [Rathayibacter rathayi]